MMEMSWSCRDDLAAVVSTALLRRRLAVPVCRVCVRLL
jgi:hypothetical protein